MPPRVEHVERLMLGALTGMGPASEDSTSEEVLNAMLNLAGRAVDIIVRTGGSTEQVRQYLQVQLMKVAPLTQRH